MNTLRVYAQPRVSFMISDGSMNPVQTRSLLPFFRTHYAKRDVPIGDAGAERNMKGGSPPTSTRRNESFHWSSLSPFPVILFVRDHACSKTIFEYCCRPTGFPLTISIRQRRPFPIKIFFREPRRRVDFVTADNMRSRSGL